MTAPVALRGRSTVAPRLVPGRRAQAGMGLLELMIAVLLGLILLFGLFSLLYGTRQTFTAQNQMAQLQDNERMAMTLLANTIQTGGYYPNPTTNTLAAALPTSGNFAAGQAVYGAAGGSTMAGDQIWVRYAAGTGDGVMDCTGQTNTGGATTIDVNTFYVNAATNQLVCQVTAGGTAGAPVALVNGVTRMSILYGVGLSTNGVLSAIQYQTGAQMTAATWQTVVSVRIQLTFANPLTGAGTNTSAATNGVLTLTRNIDLLNRT